MNNDDFIMDSIYNILRIDTQKPEDGYFRNIDERTYRCEAIRQMFCGLQKEGQDKVLRLAMELLIGQNSTGIGVQNEIALKGALHNGQFCN